MPVSERVGNNKEAVSTVMDNLGLDPEELGLGGNGNDNDIEDLDESDDTRGADREIDEPDDDEGGGEELDADESDESDLDDMRMRDDESVTHTRQQQRQQPRQFQRPDVKADRAGNLRDAQTGAIVARAGREARYYQGMHKARAEVNGLRSGTVDLGNRLNEAVRIGLDMAKEVKALREKVASGAQGDNAAAKQLGLSAPETLEALQLFALGKTNPAELLKKILTRATLAGIDVKSLGLQPGVDSASLLEMIGKKIDDRMKPLEQRTAAEQEADRQKARANEVFNDTATEVNAFFTTNREAMPFLPVFHAVLKQNPRMSLDHIWSRVQLHLLQKRQRSTNSGNGRGRTLPNGQGRRGMNGRRGDNSMASLDMSYDQILNEVFDDLGGVDPR